MHHIFGPRVPMTLLLGRHGWMIGWSEAEVMGFGKEFQVIVRSPLGRALVWIAIPAGIFTAIFHVREIGFLGVFAAYTTLLAVGVIMLRSPGSGLPATDVGEEIDDGYKEGATMITGADLVGTSIADSVGHPAHMDRWE